MEVWLFPKGRPKPGDEVKQGNVYKLIYVFKRISLAALWWKDGKKVRVKMRRPVERWVSAGRKWCHRSSREENGFEMYVGT